MRGSLWPSLQVYALCRTSDVRGLVADSLVGARVYRRCRVAKTRGRLLRTVDLLTPTPSSACYGRDHDSQDMVRTALDRGVDTSAVADHQIRWSAPVPLPTNPPSPRQG